MNNQATTILATLLAFDTTSRESNLAMIDYINRFLSGFGIESRLFFDEVGKKGIIYERLGPPGPGGVIQAGHTAVCPVDGRRWPVPPFELTLRDGLCYGRGSSDMKGFIACVLASVPAFLAQPLTMPLHLAFSYDEEVGCLGVRSLVNHLKASTEKPALCIIGEPTGMRPVYGHKGKLAMRCHIHGKACHSAYAPEGVNAIEYAAKLMTRLGVLGEKLALRQDARFDPPYSTVQVGLISGGAALNIVPERCQFDFEIRHLPDVSLDETLSGLQSYAEEELVPAMRAVAEDATIRFHPLSQYPGLLSDPQSAFAGWLAQWAGNADFATVAFGTEGGLFDEAGVATMICGPGSMEQGHKPDEFIALAELEKCLAMLDNLRHWMAVS